MRRRRLVVAGIVVAVLCGAIYQAAYGAHAYASFQGPCPLERPINVVIRNWSAKRVVSERLLPKLWKDGRSTNILSHTQPFEHDRIVEPFSSATVCFPDLYLELPTISTPEGEWNLKDQLEQVNWLNNRIKDTELRLEYTLRTEWPW
ncbi:hypothetical protein I6F26_10085 [Ensifer sp. IC3342]|nr:hypothetical protein [Ensifer sp. BRP08]MCA1446927.1 hypothetical protein [Ensifer sp. IC3342]